MSKNISRTEWFHEAKWGTFMHFVPPFAIQGDNITAVEWNKAIDGFDVDGLARQLHEAKARYFFIALGQNSGHYLTPNATYDELVGISPSKCSKRDLVEDLYKALEPYGIRTMVYLPTGAPEFEPQAVDRLQWSKGSGRNAEFQKKWEAIIREWSLRWGKHVHGWWFDGCYFADEMYRHADEPNFKSFAAAIRAGNPESLVAWNPGVTYPPCSMDAEEDYTGGEINEPQFVDAPGRWDGREQFHMLTFIGKFWGEGPVRFTPDEAVFQTLSVVRYGGVITWDAPFTHQGLYTPEALEVLKAIGKAVDAERGKPDVEPPHPVRARVSIVTPPSVSSSSITHGKISLKLLNPWPHKIQGKVTLSINPESFATIEDNVVQYELESGEEKNLERTVKILQAVDDPPATSIVVHRDNDNGKHLTFKLPRRELVDITTIAGVEKVEDVQAKLAALPWRALSSEQGRGLAEVKYAVSGENFIFLAKVADAKPFQTPLGWDASCIELFASVANEPRIHQLFLLPKTEHDAAKTLELKLGANNKLHKIIPCSEIQHESKPCSGGYLASAIIPLKWWLKSDEWQNKFVFEFIISVPGVGRRALFGDIGASHRTDAYAQATIL